MYRHLVLATVVFALLGPPVLGPSALGPSALGQSPVPIDLAPGGGHAVLSVLRSDATGVVVQAKVESFGGTLRDLPQGRFLELSLPLGAAVDTGRPGVPAMRTLLEIPFGARDLGVEVRGDTWREVPLAEIEGAEMLWPVQPPAIKVAGTQAPFAFDRAAYTEDAFVPESTVSVRDAGVLRGHRLLSLTFRPVRYNPARATLRICTEARIAVTFRGADAGATARIQRRYGSPYFDEVLSGLAANGPLAEAARAVPSLPAGYLIIVPPSLEAGIQTLADWKSHKGFSVTVANTTETGTTTTQIKSYIQTAYDTWPVPPTFVLLVGDVADIPAFTGSATGSVTDLYYTTMDVGDYFPDVMIGRISVENATQLATVTGKLLQYEQVTFPDTTWIKKAAFMASTDNHEISEGTHNYVIDNYLNPAGYTCDKLYTYTYGATTQDVKDSLNDGRSLAVYSGHGYETGWADGPPFDPSDVNSLMNLDKYPFVMSHACLTGAFDTSECFAETWIRAPGKGGLIFWGSSTYTYWDEDDILEKRMFQAAFQDGLYHLTGMTNQALLYLYDYYGGAGLSQYYFECYNVHGDPSLFLHTEEPASPSVTYETAVPVGAAQVHVTALLKGVPLAEALVHLEKAGEVFASAYTDASGQAVLDVSTGTPGLMDIVVTAHNAVPYEDQIVVFVPSGPYVVLEDYTVGDSAGNGDGDIDIGESIDLPVAGKNVGVEVAYGVTGTLATSDTMVTVTDGDETFGDVNPDETVWCADDFDFDVSPLCEDGHVVPFTVTFGDTSSNTWSYSLGLQVNAPRMVFDSFALDDSAGNGDGIADPGESVSFQVTLRNDGHHVGENVSVTIHTADPYCTITQDTSPYPSIQPGGSGSNQTPFVAGIDSGCPVGHSVTVVVDLYRDGNLMDSDQFTFTVSKIPVLLIDLDQTHNSAPAIASTLSSLGVTYETTTSWPTRFDLHANLFICLGIFYDNTQLTLSQANDLVAFLQTGGNVYMEGGDCWYYDDNAGVYSPYFGIGATDDGSGDTGTIVGQTGTIADGLTFQYGGENSWMDHMTALTGAEMIFRNQSPSYGDGVSYDSGSYRTIGAGFEFGGLTDGGGGTKLEWMSRIVDFLVAPGPPSWIQARAGTVNLGAGSVADVLFINGSAGDAERVLSLPTDTALTATVEVPPAGPNPAPFAIYIWTGEPDASTLSPQPANLGDMVFGTFLSSADGTFPFKVFNNIGKPARLGTADYPSTPAPSTLFHKGSGLHNPVTLTFQGFILDDASAADKPASVTNAVILKVQ